MTYDDLTSTVRVALAEEYFCCDLDQVGLDRELLRDDEGDSIAMQTVFLTDLLIDLAEDLGIDDDQAWDVAAEELLSTGGTVADLVTLLQHHH